MNCQLSVKDEEDKNENIVSVPLKIFIITLGVIARESLQYHNNCEYQGERDRQSAEKVVFTLTLEKAYSS